MRLSGERFDNMGNVIRGFLKLLLRLGVRVRN